MEKEQEDIVWPTIMEVGGIIIGLAVMLGGITQIYKRFHQSNKLPNPLVIDLSGFVKQVKASNHKPHHKKPKDS